MFLILAALLLTACGAGGYPAASTTTASVGGGDQTTEAGPEETTATTSQLTTTSELATTTTEVEPEVTEIVVEEGQIVGGVRSLQTEVGSVVRLLVSSDTADHVHVHGYDLFFDVAPGTETEIKFTADVPGIFEIEMEGSHLTLLELEVS